MTSQTPRVVVSFATEGSNASLGYFVVPEALARGINALLRAHVAGDAAALGILPGSWPNTDAQVRFAEWLDGPTVDGGVAPAGYSAVADALNAIERGQCPVPPALVRETRYDHTTQALSDQDDIPF